MEVKFFGTGSCLNRLRGNISFWIKHSDNTLLFDCGERTYHQIMKAEDNPNDIDSIFVSHNHGDHIAGLPTLIFGMHVSKRQRELIIYGPEDIDLQVFYKLFYSNLPVGYSFGFRRLESGKEVYFDELKVKAFLAEHGLPALMYSIETPEGKVFYTGDSQPVEGYIEAARDADLLIHDCTYLDREKKGEWEKYNHSSARESGYAASRAKVGMLALVYIGMSEDPRGNRVREMIEEAGTEYKGKIIIPNDFDMISL